MREYFIELTERTISSARNAFWFTKVCLLKGSLLLFYLIACLITGFNVDKSRYLINCIVVLLDVLGNVCIWIITNSVAKSKNKSCLKRKKAISIMKIICITLRLVGSLMILINVILSIDADVGNLAINIMVMLFSIGTLLVLIIKEYLFFVVKYVKYKTKKELKRLDSVVFNEILEEKN